MDQVLNLFSVNYLFHKNLGPFTSSLALYLLLFLVFLMFSAFVFRLIAGKKNDSLNRKISKRFFNFTWTMGAIGIILWIFRQINVYFLSAPILWVFWLLAFVVWLLSFLNYVFRVVPNRRKEIQCQATKKNYLP